MEMGKVRVPSKFKQHLLGVGVRKVKTHEHISIKMHRFAVVDTDGQKAQVSKGAREGCRPAAQLNKDGNPAGPEVKASSCSHTRVWVALRCGLPRRAGLRKAGGHRGGQ